VSDLHGMLELSSASSWQPPVVRTVATTGEGVDELFAAVRAHRAHLESTGESRRRRDTRLREELKALVAARVNERVGALCAGPAFDAIVEAVEARRLDPYSAAERVLAG
jgi:LAO/AO transport system kinase